jgi:hypothetical protein
MLSAVMIDFGHCIENTSCLAHTTLLLAGLSMSTQAQLRAFTKPLVRQLSQFHAAGDENRKWNAIRSFFVRLRSGRAQT